MHVHVQRDNITKEDFFKMMNFFYKEQTMLKIFSGRGKRENAYVSHYLDAYKNGAEKALGAYSFETHQDSNNCIRLNSPSGTPTIEFRLFNGTLELDKFLANIQFVERTVNFVRNSEVFTRQSFVNFILNSGTDYTELISDLDQRGLLSGYGVTKKEKEFTDMLNILGMTEQQLETI
jgi:hypothetical protein